MAKRKKRRKNPSPLMIGLSIAGGVAAVGAGYAAYRYNQRRMKRRGQKALTPEEALQGVIGNSTLEEAAFMVDDVRQPILLQTPSDPLPVDDEFDRVTELKIVVVRPQGKTTIEEPAGAAFGISGELGEGDQELVLILENGDFERYTTPQKAIAQLITGLSPTSAQLAYELASTHIADKGVNWSDMEQRDAATQQILVAVAPKVDWTERLKPHTYGSAAWKAWVGVQTVGTIANQSHFNKIAAGERVSNPLAAETKCPPGQYWNPPRPARCKPFPAGTVDPGSLGVQGPCPPGHHYSPPADGYCYEPFVPVPVPDPDPPIPTVPPIPSPAPRPGSRIATAGTFK